MPKHVLTKLESAVKALRQALLADTTQAIARDAGQGDLSENAEYEQALAKRDMYQSKVVTVEKRITELASLDVARLPRNKAAYGSLVVVLDLDSEQEYTYKLVLPEELGEDPTQLSISSPIGMALVGQEEGGEVRVQIPAGVRRYEILELKTIHDVA